MGSNIFDLSELDAYSGELLALAEKKMPKKTKQFMKKEGRKLRQATVKKAKAKTNKKTGNYYKGIKDGKVYTYTGNGGTAVRVYSGKPAHHAHLLEYGHRLVKNGKEIGFVPGLRVFEESGKEFENTFYSDIDGFLDEAAKDL